MPHATFDAIAGVLTQQFHVEPEKISPQASLHALGLDSLSLMEFRVRRRRPFRTAHSEERLDPRQRSLTLADLCAALDEALAARTAPPVTV